MAVIEIGGIKIRVIDWREGISLSEKLAFKILDDGYVPDLIIAISRGGLIPARIVSDVLGVDDVVTVGVKYWSAAERRAERPLIYHGVEPGVVRDKRTLVVDEVADTGSTLRAVKTLLEIFGASEVRTAVLHYKSTSSLNPDYYVERLDEWMWISYPWSRREDIREFKKRGHDLCPRLC